MLVVHGIIWHVFTCVEHLVNATAGTARIAVQMTDQVNVNWFFMPVFAELFQLKGEVD